MKILVRTLRERAERYFDLSSLPADWEIIWAGFERDTEKLLKMAQDADAIFADAIEPVPAALIHAMPKLKIIHSEGVGFEQIDLKAAAEKGVYVCNNRAANAKAVAEHTLMLMLAVLRRTAEGDFMVKNARQIEAKSAWSLSGIRELWSLNVGLIGMGSIGQETVKRLRAFECPVYYFSRTRLPAERESELGITYLPLETLYEICDIVSLHLPANEKTRGFIGDAALNMMKPGSILINTARGELVDQPALIRALQSGKLAGAGLDCVTPEPVPADHPFLMLDAETQCKLTLSPHIGGITVRAFEQMHAFVWNNIRAVSEGERPQNIVNGL